jgi:hypothetical protein
MPSADHVKALISSLAEGDEGHFFAIAMQIAAYEARMGAVLSGEILGSPLAKACRR